MYVSSSLHFFFLDARTPSLCQVGGGGGRSRVAQVDQAWHMRPRGLLPHPILWGLPLTLLLEGEPYGLSSGAGLALDWLCGGGCCFYSGWAARLAGGLRNVPARLAPQHNARSIATQVKLVVRPPVLGNNNNSLHTVLAYTFVPQCIEILEM